MCVCENYDHNSSLSKTWHKLFASYDMSIEHIYDDL